MDILKIYDNESGYHNQYIESQAIIYLDYSATVINLHKMVQF